MIGISGSLICSKTLMELIFNPCCELRWSPEGPVSQIHSPHLHAGAPGIFSDLLRFVQILKREWGAESNGKLPHLFISSKTETLVPEFAVEDLPWAETATVLPAFAVDDLLWVELHLGSWVCSGRPALDRTATLVPAFTVNALPLCRTLMMMMISRPSRLSWNLVCSLFLKFLNTQ